MVIQKFNKGNSIVIVIVDRDKYIKTMDNFLSNQCKFQSPILYLIIYYTNKSTE